MVRYDIIVSLEQGACICVPVHIFMPLCCQWCFGMTRDASLVR
uniref:Uncharacterized protein n=1 Tax=Rhizophora mucronata TaxID=61149 RepID=A0A2P2Q0W0_RHIMU